LLEAVDSGSVNYFVINGHADSTNNRGVKNLLDLYRLAINTSQNCRQTLTLFARQFNSGSYLSQKFTATHGGQFDQLCQSIVESSATRVAHRILKQYKRFWFNSTLDK
jgi:hypothetical protein